VVCVLVTGNLRLATARGNVVLRSSRSTGLEHDSVANVSQILTLDKEQLEDRIGRVSKQELIRIFAGIDLVLGRNY
jgi:mRNA interferase MazF